MASLTFDKRVFTAVSHRAFTLTEMMITITVLGILVTMAMPAYFNSQSNQNLERCRDQIITLARAEELYRLRNRTYTTSLAALDLSAAFYELPSGTNNSSTVRVKCPADTVTTRAFSYAVALFTDTDGSPGFTITEACGLHAAGKARRLTSNRNGLTSDSSGIVITDIPCR